MLNRRTFFAAVFAVPVAASLPQTTCEPSAGLIRAGRTLAARQIIDRAFVTIGVIAPGEHPSFEASKYALGLLNEIVAGARITSVGTLSMDSPVPLLLCQGLRTMLAENLFPAYYGRFIQTFPKIEYKAFIVE